MPETDQSAPTEANRKRLAELADRRRQELRLSALRVLPSHETWRRVVRGEKISDKTRRNLEDALDWEPFSVDEVLRGGEPTPRRAAKPAPIAIDRASAYYLTRIGERMPGIAGNTPDEQARILELLDIGWQRIHDQAELDDNS